MVLQIQFAPSKQNLSKENTMNRISRSNRLFSNAKSLNAESLAVVHEDAKQHAQALRREAISGLIDKAIAWVLRSKDAARNASTARSEAACHS
jgi:hypothetical protein